MLKIAAIVASVLLVLGAGRIAAAQEWQGTPARLGVVEGEVLVQVSGTAPWSPASSNTPLGPGDGLWVARHGRAEIQLPAGNVVRLGDETRLELRALPGADRPETRLGLERGSAVLYARGSDPDNRAFAVDVPQASLQASLPATFRTDVLADGTVQVSVRSGEVTVQSAAGSLPVRGQQTLRLSPGTAPQLLASAPPDEFDRWNALREQQLARPPEPSPLPAQIASYASDFATYGHWVWVPDYGYAWAPVVPVGWTPFRFGRWIWWRDDFVWIADEAWGWVPFHYGRWYFYPVVGWVWVPPVVPVVVWHPAVVGWIHGPDVVAWCPLAPGEVFVGHRFHGPGTVSITNVNVTTISVTNVFVNARAKNATIIAKRDTFVAALTGRRVTAAFAPAKDLVLSRERLTIGPPPQPAALSVGIVKRETVVTTLAPLKAHDRPLLGLGAPPPTPGGAGAAVRPEIGLHRPGTGGFVVPPSEQPAPRSLQPGGTAVQAAKSQGRAPQNGSDRHPGGIGHQPSGTGPSGPSVTQDAGPRRLERWRTTVPESGGTQALLSPPLGPRGGLAHSPGAAAVGPAVVGPKLVGPVSQGSTVPPHAAPAPGVTPAMAGVRGQPAPLGPAGRVHGVGPVTVTPPPAGGIGWPKSP